jgi:hypothetical protein
MNNQPEDGYEAPAVEQVDSEDSPVATAAGTDSSDSA